MNNQNEVVASLFKPVTNKSSSRKVWSVDLETVWLPFFTATNTMGISSIEHDALGCPLRLAYNQDKSVKFNKDGKPVIKVADGINKAVRMVRENFVATLQNYAHEVYTNNGEQYKAEVSESIKAGKPISERDSLKLTAAIEEQKRQAEPVAAAAEPVAAAA